MSLLRPLDFRVKSFGDHFGDRPLEIGDDVFEWCLEHFRDGDHRLEPALGRPVVSAPEERPCQPLAAAGDELH